MQAGRLLQLGNDRALFSVDQRFRVCTVSLVEPDSRGRIFVYNFFAVRGGRFQVAVLKEHHDAGKGLWLTELGWSSQHPTKKNSFAKGRSGQVTQLRGAFRVIKKRASKWHVQRVYWFSIDDQRGSCNFCDGSGLFKSGFVPKPAWTEYVKFAGGTP